MSWMKTLRAWIGSVRFWKDDNVPGVADQIRKTQLRQDQQSRQSDMQELLRMVEEGRLHEADDRQLETLKLSLELNHLLEPKTPGPVEVNISSDIIDAVKAAIAEQLKNSGGINYQGDDRVADTARPDMRAVTLGDIAHEKTDLEIQGDMKGDTGKSSDDAAEKRELLKKIKNG